MRKRHFHLSFIEVVRIILYYWIQVLLWACSFVAYWAFTGPNTMSSFWSVAFGPNKLCLWPNKLRLVCCVFEIARSSSAFSLQTLQMHKTNHSFYHPYIHLKDWIIQFWTWVLDTYSTPLKRLVSNTGSSTLFKEFMHHSANSHIHRAQKSYSNFNKK